MPHQPDPAHVERRLAQLWDKPRGVRGWFMAVNNRPLGLRYMATSLMFFTVGGLLALLIRAQLTVSENNLLGPDVFNEVFTMHGSTMMYLFAVPFIEGLALYLTPMLIGSRDVAFPRLSSFGYWLYLCGGLMMYASFLVGQVPDAGWFAYTPLSGPQYAGIGLDFWLLGLGLVEIAGLGAAAEIVVSILKFRAPGMAIHRMPLLVWSFLVAGIMILFGFTPLLLATLLLELDRTAGFRFFDPEHGGSSLLWQHLFWFFGHPEVYIIFIPATGVVSTIIPTFARRPIVAYTLIVVALVLTGFVSFGLWVHHMFTTGIPQLSLVFFAAASFMIAIASGTQIFAWIATLWASRPRYDTPLLYILGFFFIFIIGGITGVMVATVPFDWQAHDTYFVVAHFHYVLIGGAVFPIFAGLYYWLPKIAGPMPIEPWGKIGFWLAFVGFNITFFPMHVMGFFGMPRRVYTYPAELDLDWLNIIATIGAAIVGLGFAVALANLAWSAWRGRPADDNPHGGGTLEWTIASPPPTYQFARFPVVRGLYPAWRNDAPDRDVEQLHAVSDALDHAPLRWRATLVTDVLNARPQALQALPGPTFVPFAAAMALVAAAAAILVQSYILASVGGIVAAATIGYWLRSGVPIAETEADEIRERLNLPLRPTGRQSVVWWGVVCLLAMIATALGALVYSYFYLQLYSDRWPQDDLPLPALLEPGLACAALLASALPLAWTAWQRRRDSSVPLRNALILLVVLGLTYLVVSAAAWMKVPFPPTINAYASAFHSTKGFSLLLTIVGLVLTSVALYDVMRGRAAARTLMLEIAELFWTMVIVVGVVVFAVVHASPFVV